MNITILTMHIVYCMYKSSHKYLPPSKMQNQHGTLYTQVLLHNLQILRNSKLSISLTAHLLHLHARSQLRQRKLARLPVNLEHTLFARKQSVSTIVILSPASITSVSTHQVRDNRANHICTRQWQTALLHDLGRSILGDMACGYDDLRLVWV